MPISYSHADLSLLDRCLLLDAITINAMLQIVCFRLMLQMLKPPNRSLRFPTPLQLKIRLSCRHVINLLQQHTQNIRFDHNCLRQ